MTAARAPTLPSSLPLVRWLAQDPAWSRLPLALRARHAWAGLWGSVNQALSQALAGQEAALPLQDPWLIVGPWRSGSTVMHELLGAATGQATPTTWQCLHASALRMDRPSAGGRSIARPMDQLPISDDSPQEDEFALLALGVPSAYRGFVMPHRLAELAHTLDPAYWQQHTDWLAPWQGFLRDVLRQAPQRPQPLILKSPNHTFRLPAILQRFGQSPVVWMSRSAAQVYHSNLKMWRAMFAEHGVTAPDPTALDDFLAQAITQAAWVLRWCSSRLGPQQFMVVDHAALLSDPTGVTRQVVARLGPGLRIDESALLQAQARLQAGRVEHYQPLLPPAVQAAVLLLDQAQQAALDGACGLRAGDPAAAETVSRQPAAQPELAAGT